MDQKQANTDCIVYIVFVHETTSLVAFLVAKGLYNHLSGVAYRCLGASMCVLIFAF